MLLVMCFYNFNGLVQDCNNSSALAIELLQSCTKPLIYTCADRISEMIEKWYQKNWITYSL